MGSNIDMEVLKESVSFTGITKNMELIKNLYLEENHYWDSCEVLIENMKENETGCIFTLIADGALYEGNFPVNVILKGNETYVYTYPVGKNIPLLIGGFIRNLSLNESGIKITLTGFYNERGNL